MYEKMVQTIERTLRKISEPHRELDSLEMLDVMSRSNRGVLAQNATIVDVGDPRFFIASDKASALSQVNSLILQNDSKAVTFAVAAGGAATVATAAGIAIGCRIRYKDSVQSADRRTVTLTLSWNDGSARSQVLKFSPTSFQTVLYVILQNQSGGKPALSLANSSGVTATVADGGLRTGAILETENLVMRDFRDLD